MLPNLTLAQFHMLRQIARGGVIDIDGHSVQTLIRLELVKFDPNLPEAVVVTDAGRAWLVAHPAPPSARRAPPEG